jgi:hypothetical protein
LSPQKLHLSISPVKGALPEAPSTEPVERAIPIPWAPSSNSQSPQEMNPPPGSPKAEPP